MFLSICIPSYNRGHLAYSLIQELLDMNLGNDIEIILSNNGSTKNKEGYEQIKQLDNAQLHYHEFATNQLYVGNYNQVIKMAKGDFCLLLSDEDHIIPDAIKGCILFLKNHPQLSVMKCKSDRSYHMLNNAYAHKGAEAIEQFYLVGNYISGVIYNRHIVTDELINSYANMYKDNTAYIYYPHLIVEAYALLHGDYSSYGELTILEGDNNLTDSVSDENTPPTTPSVYGTYESRLLQFEGFSQHIFDLHTTDDIKLGMFMKICFKTLQLINIYKDYYIQKGYNWNDILEQCLSQIIHQIDNSRLNVLIEKKELALNYIIAFLQELQS